MDREKLERAAKKFAAWETINSSERMSNFYCSIGFSKGAEWLMQQPLSERLSDKEKEKIIKLQSEIFKEIMDAHDDDDWQSVAHYILDVMPRTFASIFGADLFK